MALVREEKGMARQQTARSALTPIPLLPQETLYVGVDIGKAKHVAGFLSRTLLQRHERFEGCPTLAFNQSRDGFRALVDRIREYVPLEQVQVLLEHTGHYHRPLEQYLLELDITVYRIHVQKRAAGMLKTDKRDALGLANTLYTQLALGAQMADKMQLVRRTVPPTPAAAQLQSLMQHRYELSHTSTQYRNKLTAICDELFPELVQVFHDPNLPTALHFREQFPTPHAIATTSLAALRAVRTKGFPTDAQLLQLQQLARETIGIKDVDRQRGLLFEQGLLIKELQLIQEHLALLQTTITDIVTTCREGQILLSMPPTGSIQAATIIATMGNIANFEKASELKSYFGWAPKRDQSGTSFDRTPLSKRGVRPMKQMLYLMVIRATIMECEWAHIYQRLLPRLAIYDERTKDYRGKLKVIGRIAGQMASMIFALLKTDQELLSQVPVGQEPPPPMLYDAAVHRRHQEGHYRSLKPGTLPRTILQLPKQQ
jgi:transposase